MVIPDPRFTLRNPRSILGFLQQLAEDIIPGATTRSTLPLWGCASSSSCS